MKKIFHLQQENRNPERLLESIKHEIRKYFKRERGKKLPEKAVFWDFDCRFGQNSDEAQTVAPSEIIKALDKAYDEKWEQCYVEIISRASYSVKEETDETDRA